MVAYVKQRHTKKKKSKQKVKNTRTDKQRGVVWLTCEKFWFEIWHRRLQSESIDNESFLEGIIRGDMKSGTKVSRYAGWLRKAEAKFGSRQAVEADRGFISMIEVLHGKSLCGCEGQKLMLTNTGNER